MTKLKLIPIDAVLCVVLPQDLVARLGLTEHDTLYAIETADGGLRLSPHGPEFEARLQRADDIMRRYPETLRILAH